MSDSIKERIRKCLNLAEDDGAMDGEIAAALRFARKLMLRHNLTEEECLINDDPKTPDEVAAVAEATEYAREEGQSIGSAFSIWENTLYNAICELVGTVQWYRDGRTERRNPKTGTLIFWKGKMVVAQKLVLYGPAEDVEDARVLIAEWTEVVVALARMKYGGALQGRGRNYAEGFARAIYTKVVEMQQDEVEQIARLSPDGDLDIRLLAGGTGQQKAIVLADRGSALAVINANNLMLAKQEQATEFLKDECGVELQSTGRRRAGGQFFGDAYRAGKEDGARADVAPHSRKPKLGGGA